MHLVFGFRLGSIFVPNRIVHNIRQLVFKIIKKIASKRWDFFKHLKGRLTITFLSSSRVIWYPANKQPVT